MAKLFLFIMMAVNFGVYIIGVYGGEPSNSDLGFLVIGFMHLYLFVKLVEAERDHES